MNKQRRAKIENVIKMLTFSSKELENIKDDEQMAYDNLPENFQESDRGEQMVDNVDILEEVISAVDEAKDILDGAIFDLKYM